MADLKQETEIYNIVRKILAETLKADEEKITLATRIINDLGAESIEIVTLLMEFEDTFNQEIPNRDAEKLLTVGDIVKYILEKMNSVGSK
jgi:acyl carrier protein